METKIIAIDTEKLENSGFQYETNRGVWRKFIPDTFRFKYYLVIFCDDGEGEIFGDIEGLLRGDESRDLADWLSDMSFNTPETAEKTRIFIDRLISEGAITMGVNQDE